MSNEASEPQPAPTPTQLMSSVPPKAYKRLIVRYPEQTASDLALFYEQGAQRLASTFTGKPEDDTILLPYLSLYRQAFELRLKHTISTLAGFRIAYVDGETPELRKLLDPETLRKRFGHNVQKLLDEVETQFAALNLSSPFPPSVKQVVAMFHSDDSRGTAFRYAGELPNLQEHADFPDLQEQLDTAYGDLVVVEDYVDGIFSAAPTLRELSDE